MGLDMYLYAEKYVSDCQNKELFKKLLLAGNLKLSDLAPNSPSGEVKVCVAYWRKANQIHGWFVDNVQEGIDDCNYYYVKREKLAELRDLCAKALKGKNHELLKPRASFIFGSTAFDEWYWKNLENTEKMLTKILNNPNFDGWDFEYRASW